MGITSKAVSSLQFPVSSWYGSARLVVGHLAKNGVSQWTGSRLRGMWVVFLGPDGAGKTSVIEAIGDGAAAGFAGCEAFHLRPRLVGRQPPSRSNSNPHGEPARCATATFAKLLCLLVANWLAYLIVILPRTLKGELVLFDRYFPDALVDPARYRIPSSCGWLVSRVANLIPQPSLYVVLDAPARLVQERKQEVAASECERQRLQYKQLVEVLPNCVVVDASGTLAGAVDEVLQRIVERHLGDLLPQVEVA